MHVKLRSQTSLINYQEIVTMGKKEMAEQKEIEMKNAQHLAGLEPTTF